MRRHTFVNLSLFYCFDQTIVANIQAAAVETFRSLDAIRTEGRYYFIDLNLTNIVIIS
jgi:hypothetical protein